MSSPDRTEHITVPIDPQSVPDLTDCLNCGSNAPIEKNPVEYSLNTGILRIVNTELVPEYFCNRCGMDNVFDTMTVGLPLDRAILAKLEKLGIDQEIQDALRVKITGLEELQT